MRPYPALAGLACCSGGRARREVAASKRALPHSSPRRAAMHLSRSVSLPAPARAHWHRSSCLPSGSAEQPPASAASPQHRRRRRRRFSVRPLRGRQARRNRPSYQAHRRARHQAHPIRLRQAPTCRAQGDLSMMICRCHPCRNDGDADRVMRAVHRGDQRNRRRARTTTSSRSRQNADPCRTTDAAALPVVRRGGNDGAPAA